MFKSYFYITISNNLADVLGQVLQPHDYDAETRICLMGVMLQMKQEATCQTSWYLEYLQLLAQNSTCFA